MSKPTSTQESALAPFPLEGGRAGDEGVSRDAERRPADGAVARARHFRKDATLSERILWAELRKLGHKFRRQAPIGPYVADFAHHGARLVIELDDYYHTLPDAEARDAVRTAWLNDRGYRVLRFDEALVRNDIAAVMASILAETVSPSSPTLPPSRGKGHARTAAGAAQSSDLAGPKGNGQENACA